MKTKKPKTKMYRVPMSSKEICFALFAFRKVIVHEDFMPVRMRLNNALLTMGLDPRGEEFNEDTEQYENLFSKTMLKQTK